MAEIGKCSFVFFALCVIYMKNILYENTDRYQRNLIFFFQLSYCRYKIQNGQNDHHGCSSVK